MADSGAVTKEAKALNPEEGHFEDRMRHLTAMEHRRALTALLPPGKVLDQAMLDDITRGAQTWAPFIVVRQLLAEAGARTIGAGLILAPDQVEQLEDQLRRNPQGTSFLEGRQVPATERGAGAR